MMATGGGVNNGSRASLKFPRLSEREKGLTTRSLYSLRANLTEDARCGMEYLMPLKYLIASKLNIL